MPALAAGSLVFALGACGAPAAAPIPLRPTASAAADSLGDHYAALELVADSVVAAQSPDDAAPSELAQVTARNLAGRIEALSGDYGTLSVAMTAADYERGVSLWMRLAMAQAALELIHEDAYRLANDPTTGPADLRDLADRLSGALELGRVSGRMASRAFGGSERRGRPFPPPAACRSCRPLASQS
jgi:broad specificity phosphatase PhoE